MITEPFFRRNLPHWQPVGGTFFITYRLAGTLPGSVLSELNRENQRLRSLPRQPGYSENEWNLRIEKKIFALWDEYLDRDKSMRWLSDPRISGIVRDNLYHHAGTKYSLWAYVIMPNHVDVVLQPDEVWMKRFAESLKQANTDQSRREEFIYQRQMGRKHLSEFRRQKMEQSKRQFGW